MWQHAIGQELLSLYQISFCLLTFLYVTNTFLTIHSHWLVKPHNLPCSWCNDTRKDQYLSLPGSTMGYPCDVTWGHLITCFAFQEFSGAILTSNEVLFDGPITWVGSFTLFLVNAHSNVMWIRLCSCASPTIGAWLLVYPNILSFHLSSTHFLITLRIHISIPHPMVAHLSWCQCGHTIDDLGIYLLHCPCKSKRITTHDMLRNTIATITLDSGTHVQKEVSHLFPHHTWRRMDIVITVDDFWTWSDVVIANLTRTNLVQGASTTIAHVATIVVQDKARSYIKLKMISFPLP